MMLKKFTPFLMITAFATAGAAFNYEIFAKEDDTKKDDYAVCKIEHMLKRDIVASGFFEKNVFEQKAIMITITDELIYMIDEGKKAGYCESEDLDIAKLNCHEKNNEKEIFVYLPVLYSFFSQKDEFILTKDLYENWWEL
jgi:hypothetical protein